MDERINLPQENQLLEADPQFYRRLIEKTPTCIKVFDLNGKLIFINKGGRIEHFIKDTDDIGQWDWVSTVKEEYKPEILAAFQRGLAGESSRVEFEHTPEGSSHAWCDGIISPIHDENGNMSELLFYSFDATAKKLVETELAKKTADLESRNSELAKMNELMVGREVKMAELKKKISELEERLGKQT
jgi:PAS domain S-box-containing protein